MSSPSLRLCFFGDSIVAGFGDETQLGWVGRVVHAARRDGWDVTGYNLGVRGETGPQIAARWRGEAERRLCRADGYGVVLAFGVNDTVVDGDQRRVSASESLAVLSRIIEEATAAGWPLLVVGPTLVDDDQHNLRIVELSEAMGAACADRGVPFVEVAAGVRDDAWRRDVASRDGAHPTEHGYERLSRMIYPAVATWLPGCASSQR
jgi:lysophospholipase L1-like esterase